VLEPEFIARYYSIKKAFFQLEEYIAIFLHVFTLELFDDGIFSTLLCTESSLSNAYIICQIRKPFDHKDFALSILF
jgi:hypothetical protein